MFVDFFFCSWLKAGGAQFLKILVQNRKPNIESFSIRVNSLEYQNLQDKIRGPISNVRNLQIFKTVGERFVEVFREEVEKNPIVTVEEVGLKFLMSKKYLGPEAYVKMEILDPAWSLKLNILSFTKSQLNKNF